MSERSRIVSSLMPRTESARSRSLVAGLPRLLLALGASLVLASCFSAVGAPLWLSATIGALAGVRVAASRRLAGDTAAR
jgi:hypothetical protein